MAVAGSIRSARTVAWEAWKPIVAIVLLCAYMVSQPLEHRGKVSDVDATTVPAWQFVETGTWDLSEFESRSSHFVETESGVRSNRAPGAIAFAVVAYLVSEPFADGYSPIPGVLLAALTSWLAVLLVAASAERLRRGLWLPAVILFGLGTPTWSISADQLWPHGPAQLMVALGVWLLLKRKDTLAGMSLAVAVLVRPTTSLLGLGVAVSKAWTERSTRPLRQIGGPVLVGTILYLTYSKLVFGSWSPVANYEAGGGFWLRGDVLDRFENVLVALASPRYGVLVWSAWLGVCVVFAYRIKTSDPSHRWIASTPAIALTYVVVHSVIEVASGGFPYGYRYPLEAVTLAAPFAITAVPIMMERFHRRALLGVAAALAIFLHLSFVLLSRCYTVADGMTCHLYG